jgi:hypothetical protein
VNVKIDIPFIPKELPLAFLFSFSSFTFTIETAILLSISYEEN